MNTIYRIVWNATTGKWVVASELAKGRKKTSARVALVALTLALAGATGAAVAQTATRPADTIVGTTGSEREVVNVAEDADDTDAANLAQLKTMAAGISDNNAMNLAQLKTAAADASPYFDATDSVNGAPTPNGATTTAVGNGQTALGSSANTTGTQSTAIGSGASVTANNGTAIGGGSSAALLSTAVGSLANASAVNAVALGAGSVANRASTISVGTTTMGRQIVNVAAGTQATDAVNVSQLTPVLDGLGGGTAIDPVTGVVTGPTYSVGGTDVHNVGDAISNLDGRVTSNTTNINNLNTAVAGVSAYFKAAGLNDGSDSAVATGAGSVAAGPNAKANGDNTIAIGNNAQANWAGGSGSDYGRGAVAIGYSAVAQTGSDVAQRVGTAIGSGAQAMGGGSVAIGDSAHAAMTAVGDVAGSYGVSVGTLTRSGNGSVAMGYSTLADGDRSVAMGIRANAAGANGVALGNTASAANANSVALGANASATANNAVALGQGSVADRANAVSIGSGTLQRQLIQVAAGVQDTDAVNLSQLKGTAQGMADALGGGAAVNADGTITKPAYTVQGVSHDNVGDALGAVDTSLTSIDGRVTKNEGDIVNLQNGVDAATRYFKADGLNDGSDNAVATGSRAVAMGASSTAASAQSIAIGFGANADTNQGTVAIGANSRATGENSVALGSNAIADRDNVVSVGAGPSVGNGTRQIINVTNGTENTDAVNVQQLKPAIAALGGGATFNANGTVTGPQYTVADLANGGNNTVNNVGDALGQLNNNTIQLDNRVTKNEGDIIDLGDRINNGSVGLVQQASASAGVTVAAATGGATVDFTGTEGTRQLKGVSEGDDGTDAVNVSQLNKAIAGVSAGDTSYFKANGLNDGTDDASATGTNAVAVGASAKASANQAVALGDSASASAVRSVALGADSVADRANTVSVGSVGKERQIVNVADGDEDTDAVNVRQLKKAGLVGDDGSLMDAVVYDAGSGRASITLGGVAGTTITNVMAGTVAPGSMDAINGGQLWGVQDQLTKLGDRVTTIENGGGAGPVPTPADPGRPGSGSPHFASSGDADKPATATGSTSVAAGEAAAASGNNSTAIGAGSSATGNNSVAIGAGSVADADNTVSVGSLGNERRITNVAAGTQRTDAANVGQLQDAMSNLQDWTQGQVNGLSRKVDNIQRQANRGIAASAALVNNMPYLPGKVTLNAGVAAYRGQSALGVGVSRWSDNGRFNVNAGVSAAQGDSPIFRLGVGVVLGD